MHSSRSGEASDSWLSLIVSAVGVALLLLLSGCIAIPLPGIKGGGIADEKTKSSLPLGTPFVDVLLRLGEPDSVSVNGCRIAYTWYRTWAVGAVGGYGSAYPFAIGRGSALVLSFDADDRLVGAENVSRWLHYDLDDTTLFYSGNVEASAEPGVLESWSAHWYVFTESGSDCTSGHAFLSAEGLSLRSEHSVGENNHWTSLIPWTDVRELEFSGNGLSFTHAATGQQCLVLAGSPTAIGTLIKKQLADNARRYALVFARWQHTQGMAPSPRPLSLRSAMYQFVSRGEKVSSLWSINWNQWAVLLEYREKLVLFSPQLPRGSFTLRLAEVESCERLNGTSKTRLVFSLPDGQWLVLGPGIGKALSPDDAPIPVAQGEETPIDHYLALWKSARTKSAN